MAHCEKNEKEKEILWKNLESKWTETLSVNDYRENQITLNSVIAQALNRNDYYDPNTGNSYDSNGNYQGNMNDWLWD